MGKRTSTGAAKSPSKAARSEAPAHALDAECTPILGLLEAARGLSEESGGMFRAMAPHCLVTPAEDRHEYQKEMVQFLSEVFAGIDQEHLAAVAEAEREIAEAEGAAEAVKARPGETEAEVAARTADRDEQEAGTKEPLEAVANAKAALAAAKALAESHGSEVVAAGEAREMYSKVLSELWTPLKVGFGTKDSRARNKLLEQFMAEFQKLNLGEPLNCALPVSLKTKTEDRGTFAKSTIDFAENELRRHVAALAEKVAGSEPEAARRAEAVTTAEAALATAFAAQERAFDMLVTAENSLSEAEARHKEARKAAANLEPAAVARQVRLMEAKAALANVQEQAARFAELRDRGRPAPADTQAIGGEEVPAPEQ